MGNPYIHQGTGSCCGLIALLNAARYYGVKTTEPGEAAYEELVDLAKCRHGSIIGKHLVAEHLGLRLLSLDVIPFRPRSTYPIYWAVVNPEKAGSHLHATLVIGVRAEGLVLVNYRWQTGPVVEVVPPGQIEVPSGPAADAFFVERIAAHKEADGGRETYP